MNFQLLVFNSEYLTNKDPVKQDKYIYKEKSFQHFP